MPSRPHRLRRAPAAATAGRAVAAGLLALLTLGIGAPATASPGVPTGVSAGAPTGVSARQGLAREPEQVAFRLRDSRITESSGLAASPTHPGIVYTHNDSDDAPRFYAVGTDGRTRAAYTLSGASARDWEGMAAARDPRTGRSYLWFGDIGDNLDGAWRDISVYRVPEPRRLSGGVLPATRYRFRYEDGPRNAEGIMVNPRTGRLYVVSKEMNGSVYEAPARLRTDRVNTLRRVAAAPLMATDAAFAPDGNSFVIRTYFSAQYYRRLGEDGERIAVPSGGQQETVTYTADGRALLMGTEGADSPVWRVPLPASASPAPSGEATPTPSDRPQKSEKPDKSGKSDKPGEAGGSSTGQGNTFGLIMLGAALAAAAIGVIAWIAYRQH
ncbi:hypothetical protein D5H75_09950 [Bailinhaonella thermotolerans]|uniref:WD40 repeat domain-containing protein n=2 Tax=Bailinhaonella thermotolerans TaxID=1070861 RepID=A0A3A4B6L9_9ACTN|nr:hypothetical protein D5H75_09950 [Bailinhaonella thermotolerans]